MKNLILLSLTLSVCLTSFSQENEVASDSLRGDALNVYMSASDYLRREIPFVNYVRDLKDAQVYVITTSQGTGSGGREYTYYLSGQHAYEGMNDTVSFSISPDETTDGRRQKEASVLKMALMRYVANTPLAEYINISFTQPVTETVVEDKWNNWVFTPYFSTSLNGQKTYESTRLYGTFSADKVTEDLKINTELNYTYNRSKYTVGEDEIVSDYNYKWANFLVVKSISDHWSYGGSLIFGASTYSNEAFKFHVMPGIEYDLFPYSESTRRQLRVLYRAGYNYVNYVDSTIYNKTAEHLGLHSLAIAYQVVQKWGSVNVSIDYSNYLHDWTKNNLDIYGSISLRVAKGLSLNLYGNYNIIHDQLNLRKGGATREEVLLQRRELETQYSYYMSFGFSYTFGSIYNNVVNPRFGNGF